MITLITSLPPEYHHIVMLTIAATFILAYAVVISSITVGFFKHVFGKQSKSEHTKEIQIAVVIAIRNEAENIERLLEDLLNQSYSKNSFKVIICNDNSSDDSAERVKQFAEKHKELSLSLLHVTAGEGKKAALAEGIQQATSDWILTTDGDCRVEKNWIEQFANRIDKNRKLISGSVKIAPTSSLLNRLEALEFSSLIASGAGAIGINQPFMCNGANMAFNKTAWLNAQPNCDNNIASGDDVFLLHAIKKEYGDGAIVFNTDFNSAVKTSPQSSLKAFFQQRLRWSAKSSQYRDSFSIITAALVFIISLITLFLLVRPETQVYGLAVLLFKMGVDFPLLWLYCKQTKQTYLLWYYPLLSILYPIYIITIATASFWGGYSWKGRRYKR